MAARYITTENNTKHCNNFYNVYLPFYHSLKHFQMHALDAAHYINELGKLKMYVLFFIAFMLIFAITFS